MKRIRKTWITLSESCNFSLLFIKETILPSRNIFPIERKRRYWFQNPNARPRNSKGIEAIMSMANLPLNM